MKVANKPLTVDAYIQSFPADIQARLQSVREAVQSVAPLAEECISYQIPTFRYHGILVHYAAFKGHLGFYALPSGNAAFDAELSAYHVGKGSVQFPHDQPLPLDLIRRITAHRVKENEVKGEGVKDEEVRKVKR